MVTSRNPPPPRSTAATAAATAAIAATAATAATATAATTAARGPRPGFVDREPTAIVVLAVQALDRRQGLVVVVHFHEAESPASAGLAVAQDLADAHRPILLEQLLKVAEVTVYLRLPT